ncbi:unnamed protein product, partial [Gulo gulo]
PQRAAGTWVCRQSSVLLRTCSQGPYPKTPELAVLPRSVICRWKTRSSTWLMAWRVVFTGTSRSTHSKRAVHGMIVLSNPYLKLNEDEPLPRSRRTIRNRVATSPTPIFWNLMCTQLLGPLTFMPFHVLGGGELPHLPACGARAVSLYSSAPKTERLIPPKSPWFAVRFEEDLWALCSLTPSFPDI